MQSTQLVIVSGGSGTRIGADLPKQFLPLLGETSIFRYTISKFCRIPGIENIVVVSRKEDIELSMSHASGLKPASGKDLYFVEGGAQRQDSVRNGLVFLREKAGIDCSSSAVLIHDVVRPFFSENIVSGLIRGLEKNACVIPGIFPKNTIKKIDKDSGTVLETVDRKHLLEVHTPQAFGFDDIYNWHMRALAEGIVGTDDAFLAEKFGGSVGFIEDGETNFKITTPYDLELAGILIERGMAI